MNPFEAEGLAAAYATDRPPVHPLVIDLVQPELAAAPAGPAVDVGCGAGASLDALRNARPGALGFDPSPAMARRACADPTRHRAVGVAPAEALPVRDGSVAVLAAAGSLDFADVDRFCREALRVLVPGGLVVVYDFGLGEPAGAEPRAWADRFHDRFPRCPPQAPSVPEQLAASPHLRAEPRRDFTVALDLTRAAHVAYLLSETNVVAAVDAGADPDEIREWCGAQLDAFGVDDPAAIRFAGYVVLLWA